MSTATSHKPEYHQQGAALVTSLVILLILTVLGVTAMSGSSLQELMAGNFRSKTIAFQAAESALSDAENLIESWITAPVADNTGTDGVFIYGTFPPFSTTAFDNAVWSNGTPYSFAASLQTAQPPRYLIEELDFVPASANYRDRVTRSGGTTVYRVTARGVGNTAGAVVLLQTTYGKRQ